MKVSTYAGTRSWQWDTQGKRIIEVKSKTFSSLIPRFMAKTYNKRQTNKRKAFRCI
jgi:hypothetical protein